uniref:Fibroblast growth factor receptor substrate 2b n=1 Tax=Cynoglossus semilaevis TaxID=244447 RepID=A0A3P8X1E1_CYNSE
MGSCLSCPDKESIPENHQSKFKVVNVDDDGNELGSGVMELTDSELVLHTHRRDDVRWPYLCLRRYGYDSNLFSFESGRRCQTGQGIFAFKCSRAEEIFNMLQEVMHSHSISVVEEAVMEPSQQGAQTSAVRTIITATTRSQGYSVPTVPNGDTRIPSVSEPPSHPSTRHPSVGSTRLPSMGEESTHPLLVTEETVHTYVNTTGLLEDQSSPLTVTTPLESPTSAQSLAPPTPSPPPRHRGEPPAPPPLPEAQVLMEPQGVRFVLGPTPVQRQLMEKRQREQKDTEPAETNGHAEAKPESAPLHSNSSAPRRHRPPPLTPDLQNVNNSAQRRTALLDYENLPALPPVWETRKPSSEEEELKTSSLNAPLSAHRPDTARRRTDAPTIFNFDFRRPPLLGQPDVPKMLNYIEVETDGSTVAANKGTSDGSNPHTPRTPTSPLPPTTPTRRTEQYALIDIERTAAMSNLQRARPRDDGTSRKTRHNSTELPNKSAA